MRLTLLAPDIVQAVVRGEEPSGMSLEQLMKQLPIFWDEQRAPLGVNLSELLDAESCSTSQR